MLGFILAICVLNTLVGALAVLVGAEAIRLAKATNTNADLLMTAALRELDALRNAADDFGHQADCIEEGVQLLLTLADDAASEQVLEQTSVAIHDTLHAEADLSRAK